MLIHSSCGGALEIDKGAKRVLFSEEGRTADYTPIRCAFCHEQLGLLPNTTQDHEPKRWQLAD